MRARLGISILLLAAIAAAAPVAASSLQEVQELRRNLRYEQAAMRLGMILPDLEGDDRAQGLLLLSQLDTDPRDARRHLADAARYAVQPATRERIEIEIASLDYARGNYRSVQSRLGGAPASESAALWLGLTAAALDETDALPELLRPAAHSELAQALLGWAELENGRPDSALAILRPLSGARHADILPTVLLWKAQAEAELGESDAALATGAELRERFPEAPESRLVQATLDELRGWTPAPTPAPVPQERIALQLGAFEDRGNALRFRAELPGGMEPVTIQSAVGERGPFYRVLVGSFESREAAEAWARSELGPRGYAWQVVQVEEARRR